MTELTVLAPDHPWLLSIIAGACAVAGANIVDAQIFTTTDGRALDTISMSREFDRDEDEARRADAHRRLDREGAARRAAAAGGGGQAGAAPRAGIKAFAVEPEVTINNQWSNRYTMVEVTGLDRPGLLYRADRDAVQAQPQHRAPRMSRPSASAWSTCSTSPTCSARKITSPTRQAAIKRALIALFVVRAERRAKPAKPPRREPRRARDFHAGSGLTAA